MNQTTHIDANGRRVEQRLLQKYSSAVTLSDMEIFIYPELLYSLVLANIMSPRLWAWKEDEWFRKLDKMNPYRRVQRLKQFIIENYEFNLDLDTWGLTTKDRELARFQGDIDEEALSQSNALFGYHGDKYYFDIDIRRHFGLDKYNSDIIPYWKTETVEAMDAFRFKDEYTQGAGECVSLATLYAAALFIVCEIPLEDIYLMATPLHSQNLVAVNEGVLTNNRRIVTKNMWFNGTELSAKAQRALRHERVTIVANNSGYVHIVYPDATIDKDSYHRFKGLLGSFLKTEINMETLANFLRHHSQLQKCFQIRHEHHGKNRYIAAERVYSYEHGSPYLVSDNTRDKLLQDIDEYEFFSEPIVGRIPLNKFDDFFAENQIDLEDEDDQRKLMEEFNCYNARAGDIMKDLKAFTCVEPRFPDGEGEKTFLKSEAIKLTPDMSREAIIEHLESIRDQHPVADLAFYSARDMSRTDWQPYVKAAVERNPVSVNDATGKTDAEVIDSIVSWPNESIYDDKRLAQPDEVWNFARGDGLEKAFCIANIWKARHPDASITLEAKGSQIQLSLDGRIVALESTKGLEKSLTL